MNWIYIILNTMSSDIWERLRIGYDQSPHIVDYSNNGEL